VTAVHAVGFAMRAARWRELGGYSTHLPGLLHEVDLCRRAQVGGAAVVLEPRSRLVHHGVVPEMWPWSRALASELDARAPGTPRSEDHHGHPAMDWRRPGRPAYVS
jgi:hypothetical protein